MLARCCSAHAMHVPTDGEILQLAPSAVPVAAAEAILHLDQRLVRAWVRDVHVAARACLRQKGTWPRR